MYVVTFIAEELEVLHFKICSFVIHLKWTKVRFIFNTRLRPILEEGVKDDLPRGQSSTF